MKVQFELSEDAEVQLSELKTIMLKNNIKAKNKSEQIHFAIKMASEMFMTFDSESINNVTGLMK